MKNYKLLIAEDEDKSRMLLKFLIGEMQIGFEVVADVSDGEEALSYLRGVSRAELPRLILTDIRMPGMDGLTLAEVVREEFPECQVIIITAYDEFEYARRGLQLGVRDFILKPFNRAELKKALTALHSEMEAQEAPEAAEEHLTAMSQVRAYVDEHISDPELSLNGVAGIFFMHPSYVSREFKKETGQNFSDYLLGKRIEKAVYYLEHTDLYAYEICEKVGMHDAKYFGKCFKRVTGKSFQEYRKQS